MEYIIARLIQAFEQGKMTRRDLVRSLAMAATAASAVGTTPAVTPAADNQILKAIAIDHISMQCKDYPKERDFYSSLLGMEVSNDDGKSCNLRVGESVLVLRNAGVRLVQGPGGN